MQKTAHAPIGADSADVVNKHGLSLRDFFLLTLQLGLILFVIRLFRVEELYGLLRITPLIFGGFVVNAWLPHRLRLPFFVLLSMGAIAFVFGSVTQALLLIGIGLALIGLCHLPVAFGIRVALIVAVSVGLAFLRSGWLSMSWTNVVLPILGAMFMFRLAVYLYDIRHEKGPVSIWQRVGYFFLLPNVCFPLFPVVDYQTFKRTYYDEGAASIYQKGLLWVCRGTLHLLMYRVVYFYLLPSASTVDSLGTALQFMVATYLLYLRISGQFHLIVGLLCLFGFNLPETHHLYYLANSFTDYWRRINIYWKDFMMKMFYYPSFMRLRRFGMTPALVLSTIIVFAGTWLLHSYQWFWLRGSFPITGPDMLFWGILGGLVVINTLREAKGSKKKRLTASNEWSFTGAVRYALKVVGMFVTITVLWTLWSSGTLRDFVRLARIVADGSVIEWLIVLAGLVALVGVGVAIQYVQSRGWSLQLYGSRVAATRSAAYVFSVAGVLAVVGLPQVYSLLGERPSELVASLREERLNTADEEELERGYYEELLEVSSYTSALWRVQQEKPLEWKATANSHIVQKTGDALEYELLPSFSGSYKEASFTTNAWGMRDKEYVRERGDHAYRAVILSSSYTMGAGVEQGLTYEALAEERLNAELTGDAYDSYEILNFSVGGYSILHNLMLFDKVLPFQPEALFFVGHWTERRRLKSSIIRVVDAGDTYPFPYIEEIIARSGLKADMTQAEKTQRIEPFLDEIIEWGFGQLAERCREHDIVPVFMYVPTTEEARKLDKRYEQVTAFAQEAGFVALTLDKPYGDAKMETVQLAPWDTHPNELGHQMLADRFFEVLSEHADVLGLTKRRVPPEAVAVTVSGS